MYTKHFGGALLSQVACAYGKSHMVQHIFIGVAITTVTCAYVKSHMVQHIFIIVIRHFHYSEILAVWHMCLIYPY